MYLLSGCDADGVESLRERLDQLGESVAIAASADGQATTRCMSMPTMPALPKRPYRRHAQPHPDHLAVGRGRRAAGRWLEPRTGGACRSGR